MPKHHPSITASLALAAAALCTAPLLHAQAPSPQLSAVLSQMDVASRSFQSASANFEWDFYEKIVHDTTKQKGSMFIQRSKGGITFGADVFDMDPGGKTGPVASKVIDFGGGALRVYTPAEKQVDMFKAGGNQASYESYLSIGFGGSGQALAQAWQITDAGPETLSDNGHPVRTEKLILTSKDPNVRNTFTHVTIWVDPTRDVSLKQVFDTPSGDTRTAFYSNIRLNSKINTAPYKIPRDANVVQH